METRIAITPMQQMLEPADYAQALKGARHARPFILPFEPPHPKRSEPYVSDATGCGGWRVTLRLCSRREYQMQSRHYVKYLTYATGGAVLSVEKDGIEVKINLKVGYTPQQYRSACRRAVVAVRSLTRLACYRHEAMLAAEKLVASVRGNMEKGSPARKRMAEVERMARRLTRLRGFDSLMYSRWSIKVAQAMKQYMQEVA